VLNLKILLISLLTLGHSLLIAQDLTQVDSLYKAARNDAFNGNYKEARINLDKVLQILPDYTEVKVLKARTYAWGKEYTKARALLTSVIKTEPQNTDALSALTDVALWSGELENALSFVNKALSISDQKELLLFKKILILKELNQYDEALATLKDYLVIQPEDQKALDIQKELAASKRNQQVNVMLGLDVFSKKFDPSFYTSLSYLRKYQRITTVLRANQASRFGLTGIQGEIDLYPKLGKKSYGYLNYGYSSSVLFPQHRIGAEYYSALAKSFDASLGMRFLSFAISDILVYTGSLGYSFGNYALSVRPFITTQSRAAAALSLNVQATRYFKNPANFIGVVLSYGYSPDIRTIQSTGGAFQDELFALISRRVDFSIQKMIADQWTASALLALARQEQTFEREDYVWITTVNLGLGYKF